PRYISPGLRGFEERRKAGAGGRFFGEDELRKADNRQLSDLLRQVPGIRLVGKIVASSRKEGMRAFESSNKSICPITIYLDGALLYDRGMDQTRAPPTIDDLSSI